MQEHFQSRYEWPGIILDLAVETSTSRANGGWPMWCGTILQIRHRPVSIKLSSNGHSVLLKGASRIAERSPTVSREVSQPLNKKHYMHYSPPQAKLSTKRSHRRVCITTTKSIYISCSNSPRLHTLPLKTVKGLCPDLLLCLSLPFTACVI